MKMVQGVIAICLILLSVSVYADKEDLKNLQENKDWYVVKQDKSRQITTYTKREDGKGILSFKVDATVDASLATLASIHFDVANIKKWYWQALESKLGL